MRPQQIGKSIVATPPGLRRFPLSESDFTEKELAIGKERRKFIIDVEDLGRLHPNWSQERCCLQINKKATVAAYRHDGSLAYPKLFIGGYKFGSQLTFRSYRRWKMRWDEWRQGQFDTQNWCCLCRLHGFKRIDEAGGGVRFVRQTKPRSGDAKFWALFESFYESKAKRSRQQSYELAREAAIKAGVPAESIPQLYQVAYHYRCKTDARRRNWSSRHGKKRGRAAQQQDYMS